MIHGEIYRKLLLYSAILVAFGGAVTAIFLGLNFHLVPPDIDPDTGEVFYEGMLHPQRWWIATAVFMITLITSFIMMGLSAVIGILTEIRDKKNMD
ncbi:hypothetical protein [Salisediminibacterium beveridgei]|uniref:Uncharacterized protein n=1 Tax=Salisediminibacterium beveridgei TaxID=632773 RepID=A0A1D7QWG5_9BACI|nr:hypothetical protein [Salisediminibacterium beveridgei]AOM83346.1 hypothetical protein BBEV_1985 [Salisediminibacterium beveridgei]